MTIFAETDRLILREIVDSDAAAFFEMDADPEVHKYLGNNPVKTIEEIKAVISFVRQQYVDNGIGRWALIEKSSGEFVGWGGMKLIKESTNNHIDFYDVGYRLLKKHWNKGYATESAKASLKYGFEQMNLDAIYGMTHIDNAASRNALEKSGLQFVETFEKDNMLCNWFKITKERWLANQ